MSVCLKTAGVAAGRARGGRPAGRCALGSLAGRPLRGARANGSRVYARAARWYPGDDAPEWLDGSLPGDYGFDPLGLGREPKNLARYREAEIIHGRWCMLAAVGMLATEALGYGNWLDAPKWALDGGVPTYFGVTTPFPNLGVITGIEFVAMAGIEALRNEEKDPVKRCYPGGAFDPLGFAKGKNESQLEELKLKEVKNGRLAMVAVAGFFAQAAATGTGPVANWADHINNPWGVNIATNGVSVPIW